MQTVPSFKCEVKGHILNKAGWIQSLIKLTRKTQDTFQGAEAFSSKKETAQVCGFPRSISVTMKLKSG